MIPPPPISTLFPYTTLFRSKEHEPGPTAVCLRRSRCRDGLIADSALPFPSTAASPHRCRDADSEMAKRNLQLDRKSTRLNSSHRCISYAVFCLKKKK